MKSSDWQVIGWNRCLRSSTSLRAVNGTPGTQVLSKAPARPFGSCVDW
ncbi:hypothetical protein [Ralstonia solanacearum]|nr:hypothetical protein [Ralstonia solanacearum]